MPARRPLTAYNLFFQLARRCLLQDRPIESLTVDDVDQLAVDQAARCSQRRKHVKTHGKIGLRDMARTIARQWKTVDPAVKERLEERSRADKAHYRELKRREARASEQPTNCNNNHNHNTNHMLATEVLRLQNELQKLARSLAAVQQINPAHNNNNNDITATPQCCSDDPIIVPTDLARMTSIGSGFFLPPTTMTTIHLSDSDLREVSSQSSAEEESLCWKNTTDDDDDDFDSIMSDLRAGC